MCSSNGSTIKAAAPPPSTRFRKKSNFPVVRACNTATGLLSFAPVNVLALTIFLSTCLAGIFILCFAVEVRRSRRSSPERDSLLPLDLDPSIPAAPAITEPPPPV